MLERGCGPLERDLDSPSRKRSGIVLPGIVLLPVGRTPFSQQAALRSPLQALPGSVEHLMPKPGSAAQTGLSQDSVYRHSNIPNPARLLSSGTLPSL